MTGFELITGVALLSLVALTYWIAKAILAQCDRDIEELREK